VIKLSDYFVGKILNHQLADMPPSEPKEIFMQCKDDIHRVGLLMLEMLSGTSSSSLSTFLPADAPLIPESVSPDASDFMLQCFNKYLFLSGKKNKLKCFSIGSGLCDLLLPISCNTLS